MAIKEAKKAYQAATAARTQHQRETNVVAAEIRRAASHDIIGYNHLWQLGATLDDFKLQTCPGVGYDGQTIVKAVKRLISSKIETSEQLRIRNGTTVQNDIKDKTQHSKTFYVLFPTRNEKVACSSQVTSSKKDSHPFGWLSFLE